VLSINIEVDCEKQQTYYLKLHFLDFAIANLFMVLLVSISHRRSCSTLQNQVVQPVLSHGALFSFLTICLENDRSALQLVNTRHKQICK